MSFNTGKVSLTNQVEHLWQKIDTRFQGHPTLNAIISRLAMILLSPAALIDFIIHTLALPISVLYAISKSMVLCRAHFQLPWQHLQRIRFAAFPALFGSIAGIIHPYAGLFMSESKNKHVAIGTLISNTKKNIDVVVSPVTAYRETIETMKQTHFHKECEHLTNEVSEWEESLEKIQGVELFDLKLTCFVLGKMHEAVDRTSMPRFLKELIKRINLLIYPLFALIDFSATVATASFSLVCCVLQWIGFHSPAYLETTKSPTSVLYQITRIFLSAIALFTGFFVSLGSTRKGLEFASPTGKPYQFVPSLLKIQFLKLRRKINHLLDGERMLLPVVIPNGEKPQSTLELFPSHNSHMTYLLLEKHDGKLSAELIERGNWHGIKENLNPQEAITIAEKCLASRFKCAHGYSQNELTSLFSKKETLIDLKKQDGTTNCVITNLFAAFEVLHHRNHEAQEQYQMRVRTYKQAMIKKIDDYSRDFYPFAPMSTVLQEINDLKDQPI